MTDLIITLSDRYELLKEAYAKRKAQKLVMADLADDVEVEDSIGVEDD